MLFRSTVTMLGNAASSLMYGVLGDLIPLRVLGSIAFLLGLLPAALIFSKDVQGIRINRKEA